MSNTLILFDVDGTLTVPRNPATPEMKACLQALRAAGYTIGLVGGSDMKKQEEQMGSDVLQQFDYVFPENGLMGFLNGKEFHRQSFLNFLGNDRLKMFIKFTLRMVADLDIPVQRGTFIEFRNGMLNISPIGRNCSQSERDDFEKYDHEHQVRAKMIDALKSQFPDYGLKYSIGGQISFDVFPEGWDKSYCLQFVSDKFGDIHFFGDKTKPGGNDFEIYTHPRVIGHHVDSFEDTIAFVTKEFLKRE